VTTDKGNADVILIKENDAQHDGKLYAHGYNAPAIAHIERHDILGLQGSPGSGM